MTGSDLLIAKLESEMSEVFSGIKESINEVSTTGFTTAMRRTHESHHPIDNDSRNDLQVLVGTEGVLVRRDMKMLNWCRDSATGGAFHLSTYTAEWNSKLVLYLRLVRSSVKGGNESSVARGVRNLGIVKLSLSSSNMYALRQDTDAQKASEYEREGKQSEKNEKKGIDLRRVMKLSVMTRSRECI
nr:hypothetical protein Iba_chr09aCG4400 [Ipomoea batatas]